MSKFVEFFDPFSAKKAKAKLKKEEKKLNRQREKREKRVLSDQAFSESSSLLGGRQGSTQAGTLLGG